MRWLEWIFTDPLAQLTLFASVLTAALVVLIFHKLMTRGQSPRLRVLIYTAMAWLMFAAPSTYFWAEMRAKQAPVGPLLHSTPKAVLRTTSGQDLALQSLRGRVVLLDFWASWCAPCQKSSPAVVAMQKEFGPQLVTIAVGVDEVEQDWRKALNAPRPAYDVFDKDQKLRWAFHVGPLPHFVVLDRSGTVDAIETGWDPASVARLHESLERNLAERR
jgi:cytochrome c biogenesis protein CcmG, thiol:disulfide interchange protein DsbE